MSLIVSVEKRLGDFTLSAAFASQSRVTALFGPSGSGKTTIVNLVAGLIKPDHGRISIDGTPLTDTKTSLSMPARRRRIGYVFQDARLFPHLSVRANLTYGRWFTPRAARWAEFAPIVDLLGIGELLDRRPRDLSGGETQRVAIGRALLASPRLLLMDEPLAALDRARRAEILPYLDRLAREMRLPILYVSHSVEEVARLADHVVLLERGRVTASGSVNEVFAHEAAASEIGGVVTARIREADAGDGLTRLDHPAGMIFVSALGKPAGETLRLVIHARDISLAVGEVGLLSIRNRLAAQVTALTAAEEDVVVMLDAAGTPLRARITRAAARALGLAPGLAVTALVKAVALDER